MTDPAPPVDGHRNDSLLDGSDSATAPLGRSPHAIPGEVLDAMRVHLPAVASATIAAVTAEVPGYRGTLDEAQQQTLATAVEMALGGFLTLTVTEHQADPSVPLQAALDGANALGHGEARAGRSMDALLAAYRVGARTAWRGLARVAAETGLDSFALVNLAELVFAYIDQLSAASVAGHAAELDARGRMKERLLERLALGLVSGMSEEGLTALAERVEWRPPQSLTAVLVPEASADQIRRRLDPRTLRPSDDAPGMPADVAILLVPDARRRDGRMTAAVTSAFTDAAWGSTVGRSGQIVAGPARPWLDVRSSVDRAARAWQIAGTLSRGQAADGGSGVSSPPDGRRSSAWIDTEDMLVDLVTTADPAALDDLRARTLAPLTGLRPDAAQRLTETLRAWLLHRGRREAVAEALFIHPQTVRYRMGQLRTLYGDSLDDPQVVLALTVALASGGSWPASTRAVWISDLPER